MNTAFVSFPKDFAQVVESGKLNLYRYYTTVNNGPAMGASMVTILLLEKDGKIEKVKDGAAFRKWILTYIADNSDLAARVSSKELKREHFLQIVKLYNEEK